MSQELFEIFKLEGPEVWEKLLSALNAGKFSTLTWEGSSPFLSIYTLKMKLKVPRPDNSNYNYRLHISAHFIDQGESQTFSNQLCTIGGIKRGLMALAKLGERLPWSISIALLTNPLCWEIFQANVDLCEAWRSHQLERLDILLYLLKTLRDTKPGVYAEMLIHNSQLLDGINSIVEGKLNALCFASDPQHMMAWRDIFKSRSFLGALEEAEPGKSVQQIGISVLRQCAKLKLKTSSVGIAPPEDFQFDYPFSEFMIPKAWVDLKNWHDNFSLLRQQINHQIRIYQSRGRDDYSIQKNIILNQLLVRWCRCQELYAADKDNIRNDQINVNPFIQHLRHITEETLNYFAPLLWQDYSWYRRILRRLFGWIHLFLTPEDSLRSKSHKMILDFERWFVNPSRRPKLAQSPGDNQLSLFFGTPVSPRRADPVTSSDSSPDPTSWDSMATDWLGHIHALLSLARTKSYAQTRMPEHEIVNNLLEKITEIRRVTLKKVHMDKKNCSSVNNDSDLNETREVLSLYKFTKALQEQSGNYDEVLLMAANDVLPIVNRLNLNSRFPLYDPLPDRSRFLNLWSEYQKILKHMLEYKAAEARLAAALKKLEEVTATQRTLLMIRDQLLAKQQGRQVSASSVFVQPPAASQLQDFSTDYTPDPVAEIPEIKM